ncbi:unnamed protein product [Rotaria sp. Silwood1]|nr:unnamed protein product [Rotaria sp. Silwood1]CAF3781830.1 unnamed protein product [Rotaria sp. Silwood1]CAF4839224.1 unnamed protein product [Rotaria sp. Silwood1]CAF4854180.1 unnamed protein product [Rotaria sp. Silwood1]
MSKLAFEHYNADIISSNTHRINALHLSIVFIYDLVLSSICILPNLLRLERLVLDKIESKYLTKILDQLFGLLLLFSLIITYNEYVENKTTIYRQILHLPALKYCHLSLGGEWSDNQLLPIATNEYNTIENLIINDSINIEQFCSVLSYILQLRRLSVHSLTEF